jgi:dCTP deaminase
MAFLGYDKLREILEKNIDPFEKELFNETKTSYQLTNGNEVYITNSKTGKKEILDERNNAVHIDPGQFALLLIHEKVTIPKDKIAFITLRLGVKVKGLINISGFHVDPGFSGKLVYSVYNAGTRTIILEMGKPYFSIWYSELKGEVPINENSYNGRHQGQKNIRSEDIEALQGELWNPIELSNRIKEIENTLSNKIIKLEGKKEKVFWAIGLALTLFIGLNLKLYLDWSSYKRCYLDGMNEIKAKQRVENVIDSMHIKSSIKHQLDSILKIYRDSIYHFSIRE